MIRLVQRRRRLTSLSVWTKPRASTWVYPSFRHHIVHIEHAMNVLGHPVVAYSGYRSYAEQNELYKQGRIKAGNIVTWVQGGYSSHNFGIAADFYFVDKNPWKESHPWKLLGETAKKLGCKWSGDWKKKGDLGHIYITYGLNLKTMRKLYENTELISVWSAFDKMRGVPIGHEWYGPQELGEK